MELRHLSCFAACSAIRGECSNPHFGRCRWRGFAGKEQPARRTDRRRAHFFAGSEEDHHRSRRNHQTGPQNRSGRNRSSGDRFHRGSEPRVLKRLRRKYPDVEVTLTEMVPTVQLEALATHRLDVGVIGAIDGKAPPGLRVECIAEEQPMAGVPSDHPLATRPFIRLQQLKEEGFILTSRENAPSYRSWLARLCQRVGFTPKVVQEVDRARTAVQYVAAGFGISIFGEHITRQPAPGVKFIPIRPHGQKIRYGIAWRKERFEPLIQRFIEYTKEQLAASPQE